MLIKHRAEHHCDVTPNKDLSVNEEYNMIMDRDKASSDHLSLPMVLPRTFRHQQFTPPLGVVGTHDSAEIYGSHGLFLF